MAGAVELRAPEPGEQRGYSRRNGTVQDMPYGLWGDRSRPAGGSYVEAEVAWIKPPVGTDLSLNWAMWRVAEPPRGAVVRARELKHHTAGLIFHRDDREGHWNDAINQHQCWWSHEQAAWMSWDEIGMWLGDQPGSFVVEVLAVPSGRSLGHPGCPPDGACYQTEHERVSWW